MIHENILIGMTLEQAKEYVETNGYKLFLHQPVTVEKGVNKEMYVIVKDNKVTQVGCGINKLRFGIIKTQELQEPNRPVTKKQFEAKIIELGDSLYQSHLHLKIHEWMTNELNKHLNEYPHYFRESRHAHYETGVLRLTRAYDHDKKTLGLLKILNIIESDYKDWGCTETIDRKILEEDKKYVNKESNPLVKKLIHLRDKAIAHSEHKQFPSPMDDHIGEVYQNYAQKHGLEWILKEGRLTIQEIEKKPNTEIKIISHETTMEVFQLMDDNENKILGGDIPIFSEFYELTTKGIEICNRYMKKLSIDTIELDE